MTLTVHSAASDVDVYVDLELAASEPLATFVYGTRAAARLVHRALVVAGEGEFADPAARLVRDDRGIACAMYTAPFDKSSLPIARLRSTRALSKIDEFRRDPGIRERMIQTRELFVAPQENDAYLSRIAVATDRRGLRLGAEVFAMFRKECETAGAGRIVLEVADAHPRARAFYDRLGFLEVGRRELEGGPAYAHLAMELS